MIEIKGKYNQAKIFTDVVDSASIAQVQELCNQEFTAGSRIRLMPDIHAGAGCTIGTTMTITDKVVPNLVGVDIGCGMETTRIREGRLELQKLDKLIYEKIPSGFSIRDKAHRYLSQIDLSELCCARHVDLLRAEKSIGTLGGGNHFIEVDKDDEGNLYIVVHSGSRHLGVEVAAYPTCEAFYFQNCGKLLLAEDVRSHQIEGSDRFIRFGVNVRFFNIEGTEDMLIDTVGMSTLFLPDLQYHFHDMDPNWVVNHAYNVASYILANDNPIQDGETVDGVENGQMSREFQWKCQYEDALIQPPRGVLDINMGDYASGKR